MINSLSKVQYQDQPSFQSAKFQISRGLKTKINEAVSNYVPVNVGVYRNYIKSEGLFNIDLFISHLRRAITEEPGIEGTYKLESLRKNKNTLIGTFKHFDESGSEIKNDMFKFNLFNLFKQRSSNSTELDFPTFLNRMLEYNMTSKNRAAVQLENRKNFWEV